MKKIMFVLLSMLMPILPIMADELAFTVDGLIYQHLGGLTGAVRLLGYDGDKCPSNVTIPATVTNDGRTYNVSTISSGAFYGCTNLVSVTMLNNGKYGVEIIEANTFVGCTSLKEIHFSNVLNAIRGPVLSHELGAFEGCTSLEKVVLPASMNFRSSEPTAPHNICKWAFKNCTNLKTVVILATLPYIEDEAFINCSSLQYLVSYVDPYPLASNTFYGIPSSATLIVPDGTKSTYQSYEGWNLFKNISEHSDYDLAAIIGEKEEPTPQSKGTAKLSIEPFEIKAGETKTMLIDMQNPDDQVTMVQFDLRLPDGLSIATGDDAVDIAGRTTWRKHTLTSKAINGLTRILLYSATNEVISGTSGAIISIKLKASSTFKGGDVKLENQLMTTPSLVESKPSTYTYNIKGTETPAGDGEPYVVYNNGTLTFYCDSMRSSRQGTAYDLNKGYDRPGWIEIRESIETVIFNSSFSQARPTTTRWWFIGCHILSEIQGLLYLNTSEVTNMSSMFLGCNKLASIDVSNFDTDQVVDMSDMFGECYNLTELNLGNFETKNVSNMRYMFLRCRSLTNLDLSKFNTAKVKDMYCMFDGCTNLAIINLSGFNTSSVTNMAGMFNNCSSLTSVDVSSFNTSKTTTIDYMFSGCSSIVSLDLSNFDTSSLVDRGANTNLVGDDAITSFLKNCSKLVTLTLGNKFSISGDLNCVDVFSNCTKLNIVTFTGDIPSSINSNFFEGVGTSSNPATLEVPDQYRDHYAAKFDGNKFFGGYFKLDVYNPSVSGEPYAVYNDFTLTFYCDDQRSKRSGITYSLNEGEEDPDWVLDSNNRNAEKVVFDASFANARPTTTYRWFLSCDILREIVGIENLNTSEVKNMQNMFGFCEFLKSVDVSHFDTKLVQNMGGMFYYCTSLESIDVSHFDTNNVWSMASMFSQCKSLTEVNLSSFNTSKVEYLSRLFKGCSNLKTVYLGSGFVSDNNVEIEDIFADCQNLSKVVFTGDIPYSIHGTLFEGVGTASKPAMLDVPEQYIANYKAKFNGNKFYGGYFTLREAIAPDENGSKDYGSGNGEIDVNTNLDGKVIGNVYYSIAPDNGGYNSAEGCLVVTKPSQDFESDDPFGDDFKGMFTGIVIMVQPGSGVVKVEAETLGGMTLKVKVGNNYPIQMTMQSKSTLAIPYSVDRPTYVYIYAGGTSGVRSRAGSDAALKIYGISWESSASAITAPVGEERLYDVYSISGKLVKRRATSLDALPKGVYIVNGRKVVVK